MHPIQSTRRTFLGQGMAAATALAWPRPGQAEPPAGPLFGACQNPDRHAVLKAAGYDFIEASVTGLLAPSASDAEFDAKIAAMGSLSLPIRSCTGFFPASLPLVGPSVNMDAVLAHAQTVFRRAGRLGIAHIVLGSGGARKIPDGFDAGRARQQFIDLGRRLGPLAEPHRVVVVLEPLNSGETNFFHRVEEGIAMVDEIGHPNVQLLADIYHMRREDEGPASLVKAGARLRHCHIAELSGRTPPGTDGDDFRPYFKALKEIGYRGGISIEGKWSKDPKADLLRAIRTMREQYAEA